MGIVTVGIDLAKNCFAVQGVGPSGKPELVRPEVRRGKLLELSKGAAKSRFHKAAFVAVLA